MPPTLSRREWLSLAALAALAGCTRSVARPEIQTRYYAVDWPALDAPVLPLNGLTVRSVILSPAQWPLEASLKRLLQGDFVGVLGALKITFAPSQIPTGVLRDLYDAGYVPVYLRVENPGQEPLGFFPERLALETGGGDPLLPVPPDTLPAAFREVDWGGTVLAVAAVALIVVMIADGRSRGRPGIYVEGQAWNRPVFVGGEPSAAPPAPPPPERRNDPGVLRAEVLAPGEAREGLVFFYHKGRLVDWSRARLTGT